MPDDRVHVAVGVIYNADKDKVLIAKRTGTQHLAGFWEFPGGKVESGESVDTALSRELFEELGIHVKKINKLIEISHDYPDKAVLLDVWSVLDWDGTLTGCEKQDIKWVSIDALTQYPFPKANKHIVSSLSLPSLYVISEENHTDKNEFLKKLEDCFSNGLKLFQLRLNPRKDILFDSLLEEIRQLSNKFGVKFILNGGPEDIQRYDIDGIHMNVKEASKYSGRPIDNKNILGVSCHDESEIIQADRLDADYIFISPVHKTKSHAQAKPLGWHRFNNLCKKTNIPVFALGGVSVEDQDAARSNGAHGIAMLSSVWQADKPGEIIKSYSKINAF